MQSVLPKKPLCKLGAVSMITEKTVRCIHGYIESPRI